MRHELGRVQRTVSVSLHDLTDKDLVSMIGAVTKGLIAIEDQAKGKGMPAASDDAESVAALCNALSAALKKLNRDEPVAASAN